MISFRKRLAFRLAHLREYPGEYTFGIVLVAIPAGWLLLVGLPYYGPVVKYERTTAIVESTYQIPTRSGPFSSRYAVRLSDTGDLANVEDVQPHEIGSAVTIERQIRESGGVTYHLIAAP
jgi:hypothetical protein